MDNGFSLVELMIVLLITAVLAAISIPAYQHHLIAAHRREAASELLQGALSLETTYQRTHRYDNASLSSINLNSTEYYDFKLNTTAHTAVWTRCHFVHLNLHCFVTHKSRRTFQFTVYMARSHISAYCQISALRCATIIFYVLTMSTWL